MFFIKRASFKNQVNTKYPKAIENLKINAPASGIWNRIKLFDRGEDYSGTMISHSEVKGPGVGSERTCTMNDELKIRKRQCLTLRISNSGSNAYLSRFCVQKYLIIQA